MNVLQPLADAAARAAAEDAAGKLRPERIQELKQLMDAKDESKGSREGSRGSRDVRAKVQPYGTVRQRDVYVCKYK